VGGSAQTTASVGLDFKLGRVLGLSDGHDLKVGGDWTYYGRNYSYYSLSGSNITVKQNSTTGEWTTTTPQDPWKIPAASQVDLHASYKFMVCKGVNATLSGTVNNLLDYQYIGKAYNSSTSSVAASADNVYVFYNFGRTYSIRLKMTF
jgi:outer membrane receptor protein involved in Fe transport